MIEIQETDKPNVIGFRCVGKLPHEDYQKILIPYLDEKIAKYAPLKALCDMRDFTGMEVTAVWDDFKYGIKHNMDVGRIATVGDQNWIAFFMKIGPLFYKNMKLKHFESSQIDEAWKWIKEED